MKARDSLTTRWPTDHFVWTTISGTCLSDWLHRCWWRILATKCAGDTYNTLVTVWPFWSPTSTIFKSSTSRCHQDYCHLYDAWIPDEGFDAGYGAYVGFHIVRKTHTHPVMLSFIALLLELKNNNVKQESKKSDAFIRARVRTKICILIVASDNFLQK